MAPPLPSSNTRNQPAFPPLTAAQIAAVLAVSPQPIRKSLRHCPATGKTVVSGNIANIWHAAALPPALVSRLVRAANAKGFQTVGELVRAGISTWKSPVPLDDISDQCLSQSSRVKDALLPTLRRLSIFPLADAIRDGMADWEKIFGHRISERHFRTLIDRTIERDGGQGNWERIELYLPKKPARKSAAPKAAPDFPFLVQAINDNWPKDDIWKLVFKTLNDLARAGCPRKRAARQLREFLYLWMADKLHPSRDAFLKTFNRRMERAQAGEQFDKRADNGAGDGALTKQIKALPWFIPAARFFYLLTNRTEDSGSVPEALRQTVRLPNLPIGWDASIKGRFAKALSLKENSGNDVNLPICPPGLREMILAREAAGQPMVPRRIAAQITVNPATVRQYRNPTNAALDFLNATGGMRLFTDERGEKRLARAGEIIEADDATINFPVCVPWNRGGDLCSEKFGVRVGRFQWLVAIDVGTSFIVGHNYTMRPRGSYRGEDVLSLFRIICLQHGIPRRWRLERGVWKSNLVTTAIRAMGAECDSVYSPHQKPFIEGLFNTLWTKLSVHFPGAHVGRFMGEHEQANDLLTACQRGQKDPRRYFPMLSNAVAAFGEVIAEKNRTPVMSKYHGRWVPAERWQAELDRPKFDPASEWIFSPFVREWTVKGILVGGRVPIFEGMGVPFAFSAPWLHNFDGARVHCHFDPTSPQCAAMLVLAEPANGHKAGELLGRAELVSDAASYLRMVLGWGDDPQHAGRLARQQNAAAMRREVRAVIPQGNGASIPASASEERDGIGRTNIIEHDDRGGKPATDDKAQSRQRLDRNLTEKIVEPYDRAARMRELEEFERQHAELFT